MSSIFGVDFKVKPTPSPNFLNGKFSVFLEEDLVFKLFNKLTFDVYFQMRMPFGHFLKDWKDNNKVFGLSAINHRAILNMEHTTIGFRRVFLFLTKAIASYRRSNIFFVSGLPAYDNFESFFKFHKENLPLLGHGYMIHWVSGLLTNMGTIIETFWGKAKTVVARYKKQIKKDWFLEASKGMRLFQRFPDFIVFFSISGVYQIAIREALLLRIPTVAFVDTDCEVGNIPFPIIGNDDSLVGLELKMFFFRELILRTLKNRLFSEVDKLLLEGKSLQQTMVDNYMSEFLNDVVASKPLVSSFRTSSLIQKNAEQKSEAKIFFYSFIEFFFLFSSFLSLSFSKTDCFVGVKKNLPICLVTKSTLKYKSIFALKTGVEFKNFNFFFLVKKKKLKLDKKKQSNKLRLKKIFLFKKIFLNVLVLESYFLVFSKKFFLFNLNFFKSLFGYFLVLNLPFLDVFSVFFNCYITKNFSHVPLLLLMNRLSKVFAVKFFKSSVYFDVFSKIFQNFTATARQEFLGLAFVNKTLGLKVFKLIFDYFFKTFNLKNNDMVQDTVTKRTAKNSTYFKNFYSVLAIKDNTKLSLFTKNYLGWKFLHLRRRSLKILRTVLKKRGTRRFFLFKFSSILKSFPFLASFFYTRFFNHKFYKFPTHPIHFFKLYLPSKVFAKRFWFWKSSGFFFKRYTKNLSSHTRFIQMFPRIFTSFLSLKSRKQSLKFIRFTYKAKWERFYRFKIKQLVLFKSAMLAATDTLSIKNMFFTFLLKSVILLVFNVVNSTQKKFLHFLLKFFLTKAFSFKVSASKKIKSFFQTCVLQLRKLLSDQSQSLVAFELFAVLGFGLKSLLKINSSYFLISRLAVHLSVKNNHKLNKILLLPFLPIMSKIKVFAYETALDKLCFSKYFLFDFFKNVKNHKGFLFVKNFDNLVSFMKIFNTVQKDSFKMLHMLKSPLYSVLFKRKHKVLLLKLFNKIFYVLHAKLQKLTILKKRAKITTSLQAFSANFFLKKSLLIFYINKNFFKARRSRFINYSKSSNVKIFLTDKRNLNFLKLFIPAN